MFFRYIYQQNYQQNIFSTFKTLKMLRMCVIMLVTKKRRAVDMTYEEYKNGITDALSNPDTALTKVSPLLDALKDDLGVIETLKADGEAKDARIRDLQDTNLKLFLSQTSQASKEEDDEPSEAVKAVDEFFANLNKEDK